MKLLVDQGVLFFLKKKSNLIDLCLLGRHFENMLVVGATAVVAPPLLDWHSLTLAVWKLAPVEENRWWPGRIWELSCYPFSPRRCCCSPLQFDWNHSSSTWLVERWNGSEGRPGEFLPPTIEKGIHSFKKSINTKRTLNVGVSGSGLQIQSIFRLVAFSLEPLSFFPWFCVTNCNFMGLLRIFFVKYKSFRGEIIGLFWNYKQGTLLR